MRERFLIACLPAALLLGPPATAKPPDLPANPEIICSPQVSPPRSDDPTSPEPGQEENLAPRAAEQLMLPPAADAEPEAAQGSPGSGGDPRPLARSLLFGIHPILGMIPPDAVLRFDDEEVFPSIPVGQDLEIGLDDALFGFALVHSGGLFSPRREFYETCWYMLTEYQQLTGQPPTVEAFLEAYLNALASYFVPEEEPETTEPPPPTPPQTGPGIIEVLHRLLLDTGDPEVPKLIVIPNEAAGNEEQESDLISQWPYLPPETEMPSLFVPPQAGDLDATPDEDPDNDSNHGSDEARLSPDDFQELLSQIAAVVESGLYTEVDNSSPQGLRTHFEFEAGGLVLDVLWDAGGNGYFIVALSPEASGDLRAAERARNDETIRWIESTSGTPAANPADDDSDDDWDPGSDDLDDGSP